MAFVPCPSCSLHVDARASTCPHCGAGAQASRAGSSRAARVLGLMVGASLLDACGGTLVPTYGAPATDYVDTDTGATGDTGAAEDTGL